MRITVIGGTGGTGSQVIEQALDAGHQVTAVVRDPSRLPARTAGVRAGPADGVSPDHTAAVPADPGALTVVTADILRPDELAPAVEGSDVVITALGPRGRSREPLVTPALEALLATKPPRVILVSNSGMHTEGDPWALRTLIKPILQWALRHHYADAMRAEQTLRSSGVPWTIARPPRLTNGPLTGTYRSTTQGNPRWAGSISRADLAHCLVHAAADPATTGKAISIGY